MKRTNPLFVDSTKFHGETIATHIELTGILPRDGEKVFAKVTKRDGDTTMVPMNSTEDGAYEGRTWLNHQEEIVLQFFISMDQIVIFNSQPKKLRASYVISEKWQPAPAGVEKKDAPETPVSSWKDGLIFDWR